MDSSWNLIVRPIVPCYDVPLASGERSTGLGEIMLATLLSPSAPSKLIWGVGPALSFPTATNDPAATGCFAAGPVVVLVYLDGPWVLGTLITSWMAK